MSAMAVQAIRRPSEMGLSKEVADVMAHLNNEGRAQFVDQILRAILVAQETNDLRPFRDVVESWFRTMLFAAHDDGFRETMDRIESEPPTELLGMSDVRERLGLEPGSRDER